MQWRFLVILSKAKDLSAKTGEAHNRTNPRHNHATKLHAPIALTFR